jgi:hypothetical protein
MYICHLLLFFVLLFENKCDKHRQKKKRYTHLIKRERERELNRHRDIEKTKKENQIMDYINTDDGFGK